MTGDDPRKFAAAMVEYSKEKEATPRQAAGLGGPHKTNSKTKNKKAKYKPLGVTKSMNTAASKKQEEVELAALDTLGHLMVDMWHLKHKRHR